MIVCDLCDTKEKRMERVTIHLSVPEVSNFNQETFDCCSKCHEELSKGEGNILRVIINKWNDGTYRN